jgi:hypothetical protein
MNQIPEEKVKINSSEILVIGIYMGLEFVIWDLS